MRIFFKGVLYKIGKGRETRPLSYLIVMIDNSRLCRCGHFPSGGHVDEHALFFLIKAEDASFLVDMGNHHFSHFVRNGRRIYSCKIFVEYM